MKRNNIKQLLDSRKWSRYRFWQELGGKSSDRGIAYHITKESILSELTTIGTLARIAAVLNVKVDDLYTEEVSEAE